MRADAEGALGAGRCLVGALLLGGGGWEGEGRAEGEEGGRSARRCYDGAHRGWCVPFFSLGEKEVDAVADGEDSEFNCGGSVTSQVQRGWGIGASWISLPGRFVTGEMRR